MTPMFNPNIHVSATREQFDHDAASVIASAVADAVEDRGHCVLVLSGGETPGRIYALLANEAIAKTIPWDHVQVFFSDERHVSPDDAQSNFGMAQRSLLSRVNIPRKNVHRVRTDLSPDDAAIQYEDELKKVFGDKEVSCDVVLLGVGDDGHTASLFPGTEALGETRKLVTSVFVPKLQANRVTLTYRTLNQAREIIVLAAGVKKAKVLRSILTRDSESAQFPSSGIHPISGSVRWMLDADAASELPPNM
jgi:6-phosphogluconolactonase